MKFKELKIQTEKCLEDLPETRDCDIKLTQAIWWNYYKDFIKIFGKNYCINLKDLYNIPSQSNITRARRKIQNDELKYLPSKLEIARKRQIKEEEWRKALGYNPEFRSLTAEKIAEAFGGRLHDDIIVI